MRDRAYWRARLAQVEADLDETKPSSTGWATKVLEALRAAMQCKTNPFGDAPLRDPGEHANSR